MTTKKNCCLALQSILLALIVAACSQKAPTVTINTAAFDSAPPAVKQCWQAAGECSAKKDYSGAATNLIAVLDNAKGLSAEQNEALQKTWTELCDKTYSAAESGDKAAIEAILAIRNSKYGRPDGR